MPSAWYADEMWKASFVATTVALGGTLDDALAAIESPSEADALEDLVTSLRHPQRSTRAAALAKAVRDVVLAIDERALR